MLLRGFPLVFLPVACLAASPTFHKDVLPVLQKRCQSCHRAGEAGPMQFFSYQETRPWAKAIREAVLSKRMPPWFADSHFGKFLNDRSLPEGEIATLVKWADSGAPEGDAKDAPKPVVFSSGWAMGSPEVVLEMQNEFSIPASGTIEYQYIVIPTGFAEDKWVQVAEARPGNRQLTHHIIAFVRPPGSSWMEDARPGVPYVPKKGGQRARRDDEPPVELLVGYAPGMAPMELKSGQAKLVRAGSDLVLQMHYTANGKMGTDRSRIGLRFSKEPPMERVFTSNATNSKFVIPPGAANHEVKSQITIQEDTKLVDLMPHMHLRGKDFEYRLVYPTGETQTILRVPRYDFNWQLFYYLENQLTLPKGTRIECTAHFDNSANNPANPDPKSEVKWGDQSWEEMMIGWFDIAVDPKRDPLSVLREKKPRPGD